MKVDVLVEVVQGVVCGVKVLSPEQAEKKWTEWGKEHGYKNYEAFLKDLQQGSQKEELRWFTGIEIDGLKIKKAEMLWSQDGETAHKEYFAVGMTYRDEEEGQEYEQTLTEINVE